MAMKNVTLTVDQAKAFLDGLPDAPPFIEFREELRMRIERQEETMSRHGYAVALIVKRNP